MPWVNRETKGVTMVPGRLTPWIHTTGPKPHTDILMVICYRNVGLYLGFNTARFVKVGDSAITGGVSPDFPQISPAAIFQGYTNIC